MRFGNPTCLMNLGLSDLRGSFQRASALRKNGAEGDQFCKRQTKEKEKRNPCSCGQTPKESMSCRPARGPKKGKPRQQASTGRAETVQGGKSPRSGLSAHKAPEPTKTSPRRRREENEPRRQKSSTRGRPARQDKATACPPARHNPSAP